MPQVTSVAVFCGASPGESEVYAAAATALGRGLAGAGIRLIYGGGRIGLMGAVADAALEAGGRVIGVIPEFLTRWEVAHEGIDQLIVTDSMHSRKQRMFELSDAFVVFAGGLGTMDEAFEILTWRQLRLHDKPILVCNVAGSADALLGLIEAIIEAGFARPETRALFEVVEGVAALLERLAGVSAPAGADADAARL